jgi:hypothetical protein
MMRVKTKLALATDNILMSDTTRSRLCLIFEQVRTTCIVRETLLHAPTI